jgi:RHS repeat-associated protein
MPENYSAAIQGEFNVDQNGSAVYSIPLQVPPGTGGIAPSLSLLYHSTVSDGIMGVGWSLQGLSAIHRTPQTPAQDSVAIKQPLRFNGEDRFTLDGQRLMVVKGSYGRPGAEYRTELETFRRVRAVFIAGSSEPVSFTVESKERVLYEYGLTPDSRILSKDGVVVSVWALSRMTDAAGNFLVFSYRRDPVTTAHYPVAIEYTGNSAAGLVPSRKVEFGYEERPHQHPRFEAGFRVDSTLRLREVKTSVLGSAVLRYELTYGLNAASRRSQLQSVVCADTNGRKVLPTRFDWLDLPHVKYAAPAPAPGAQFKSGGQVIPLDVSGNGRRDLINVMKVAAGGISIQLMKSREEGSGFEAMEPQLFPSLPWAESGLIPMDIDGDGETELLHVARFKEQLALTLLTPRYEKGHWSFVQGTLHGAGPQNISYGGRVIPMDVNGDGRVDLVYAYSRGDKLQLRTLISNGETFEDGEVTTTDFAYSENSDLLPLDFDGNGVTDLLYAYRTPEGKLGLRAFVSDGRALRVRANSPLGADVSLPYGGSLIVAPLKEDANDDLIYARSEGGKLALYTLLGTGAGYQLLDSKPLKTQVPYDGLLLPTAARGAGMIELLAGTQNAAGELVVQILRWNGNGFELPEPGIVEGAPRLRWGGQLIPADFTGKGKTDLLYGQRSGESLTFQVAAAPATVPGRLRSIREGSGGSIEIAYKPLTDGSVYDKGAPAPGHLIETGGLLNAGVTGATWAMSPSTSGTQLARGSQAPSYALTSRQFPEHVVSEYVRETDRKQRYTYRYRYTGCRIDMTGRGWLGFASRETVDPQVGALTIETYQQIFPTTGVLSGTEVRRLSDRELTLRSAPTLTVTGTKHQMSAPGQVLFKSGSEAGVFRTEVTRTIRERYTPGNSTPDIIETDTDQYDDFGNVVHHRSEATNRETMYLRSEYLNDASAWIIGQLQSTSASSDAEGAIVLRKTRYDYNPKCGKPSKESEWDDVHNRWLTTQHSYDAYDNEVSVTDCSGATATCEYDPVFHSFVSRKTLPADANGKSLTLTCEIDPAFGQEVAHVDANGLRWMQKHDGLGRLIESYGPGSGGSSVLLKRSVWGSDDTGAYNELQQRTSWTEDHWDWRRAYTDSLGREFRTLAPGANSKANVCIDRTHNAAGEAVKVSLPYFEGTEPLFAERTYDMMGRLVRETEPTAGGAIRIVETSYPRVDHEVRTEAGRVTEKVFVHYGNEPALVKLTAAEGGVSTCEYDVLGRMVAATDPAGVATRSRYDSLGRRTELKVVHKGGIVSSEVVERDDLKRTSRITSHKGNVTELQHDARGRLVRRAVNVTDVTTWEYDDPSCLAGDRLASITMPGGMVYSYSYDAAGNTAAERLTLEGEAWTTSRSFSPNGKTLSLRFPDGSVVTPSLALSGAITGISFTEVDGSTTQRIADFADFTPLAHPRSISYGNGLRERFEYAGTGQLASQLLQNGEAFLSHTMFEWDAAHQLTKIEDRLEPARTQIFGYDKTGRLVSAKRGGTLSSFGYDHAGNLTLKDGITYTYEGQQAVAGTRDGKEVFRSAYDADGNMTGTIDEQRRNSLRYDGLGRLVESDKAAFVYDHAGRRLVKRSDQATTLYISPEFEVTVFANGARECTRYIPGLSGPIAQITRAISKAPAVAQLPCLAGVPVAGIRYLHTNQINSTTLHTGPDGAITGKVEYKPFGEVLSLTGEDDFRRKFTGKELDAETGLYYFHSRYYDPRLGRFISSDDRAGASIDRSDNLNRYAYVLNSPLTGIDFDGHFRWDIVLDVVIGVAAVALIAAATIMTGGGAAVLLVGLAGSTLMGAAVSASFSSYAQSGDNFSWGEWGTEAGIGAATGLISGGLTGGGVAASQALTRSIVSVGWRATAHIGLSAVVGAASGVVSGMTGNALRNAAAGRDAATDIGAAALKGLWQGAISGAASASAGMFLKPLAQSAAQSAVRNGYVEPFLAYTSFFAAWGLTSWAIITDPLNALQKPPEIGPAPGQATPSSPQPSLRFTPVF